MNGAVRRGQPLIAARAFQGNRSIGRRRLNNSTHIVQTDWTVRGTQANIAREVPQL
jgi:hypothetical protein